MKKSIGHVTDTEKVEIKLLFERKNALYELAKIITEDNAFLYEMLVKDLGETSTKFQNWWDEMSNKYKWESQKDSHWEIDFTTGEINLVKDSCFCQGNIQQNKRV